METKARSEVKAKRTLLSNTEDLLSFVFFCIKKDLNSGLLNLLLFGHPLDYKVTIFSISDGLNFLLVNGS